MKIYKESTGDYPAVKVQDDATPTPSGYVEVTDIVELERYGVQGIDINISGWYDKKCVRGKLKTAVYAKMQVTAPADVEDQAKFDLLTDEEKSIATHWFLVGKEDFQLEVVNDDRYWSVKAHEYRCWTMAVRQERLEIMEAIVFRRVLDVAYAKGVLADLNQITKDTVIDIHDLTKELVNPVKSKRMTRMYVEGLESEENDGVVAIKDYIDETAGTPFANGKGFRGLDSSKFRTGHTPDSVADELLKVIDNTW